MGLRADQRHETVLIGSPEPTRSRSAERSSSLGTSNGSWDCVDGISHTNSNKSNGSRNRSGSVSVGSNGHCRMQRSNSDPFDDGGVELVQAPDPLERVGETDTLKQDQTHKVKALPTLYRFPCTQTRNQNCWSETPAEMFAVRGHNYTNGDKTKIRCKHYLLQSRGCDLFNTQENNKSIDDIILEGGLGGNIRKSQRFCFASCSLGAS